jgi:hypothetical protein
MRHPDRLAIGGTIYRPHDSRVRDRNLNEFRRRLPPLIAFAIVVAVSLALWAAMIWGAIALCGAVNG